MLGAVHAYVTVTRNGDQIISGIALNIVALGMTTFLLRTIYGEGGNSAALQSKLPWMLYVAITAIVILVMHLAFGRTVWGLRSRASGERPQSLWEAGVSVSRLRFGNVVLSGALAGLGGTYLSLSMLGQFTEGMSAGRGFLALAAIIFGRWQPLGAAAACLAFGLFNAAALAIESGTSGTIIPSEVLNVVPYVAAIVALSVFARRGRPPAALGRAFGAERA